MKKIRLFILISFAFTLFQFTTCKDDFKFYDEEEPEKRIEQKFYSKGNEGKWPGKSDKHSPVIKFISDDTIKVTIPLRPTLKPRHYIEVIGLMKGDKEIAAKKLSLSRSPAEVEFKLPDPDATDYSIFSKCNIHGMWIAPVKDF